MYRLIALLFLFVPSVAIAGVQSLARADKSTIQFNITGVDRSAQQGAILLLQGSGCDIVGKDEKVNAVAPQITWNYAVVTVEKYGVGKTLGNDELVEGCPAQYWRGNTLKQRVADILQMMGWLRSQEWWNGKLIVFGGSEGGWVAAMLAPQIPEAEAVIIWSSGLGVPVGELITSAIPQEFKEQADRTFDEARRNPTGEKRWGGASYKWWAESENLVAARVLAQADIPVLLIHGTRDQNSPVASARAGRDILASTGKPNFTYREYDGYDHFMKDAAGIDHRDEVLQDARDWLLSHQP